MASRFTWDVSCDPRATRARAERVCDEVVRLIGPDGRGVTVEVKGAAFGEIRDGLQARKVPFGTTTTTGEASALHGSVVVSRGGTVVGNVTARAAR